MIRQKVEEKRFRCALTGEFVTVIQALSIVADERGVVGITAPPTYCTALSTECPNACLHGAGDDFARPVDPRTGEHIANL